MRLAALIAEVQAGGPMSEELAGVLVRMCKGIAVGKFGLRGEEVEEAVQEFVVLVLGRLHRIDPDQQPFNYLTAVCFNLLRGRWRDGRRREKVLRGYALRIGRFVD